MPLLGSLVLWFGTSTGPAPAQYEPLPDGAKNHWVYQEVADLHSERSFNPYLEEGLYWRNRTVSRLSIAIAVNATFCRIHGQLEGLKGQNRLIATFALGSADALQSIKETAEGVTRDVRALQLGVERTTKELLDLIAFVRPQLSAIGVDPVELAMQVKSDGEDIATFCVAKVGEALEQSPARAYRESTVPLQSDSPVVLDDGKTHWVFQAISDLKSEGILVGYPEGLGIGVHGRRSSFEIAIAASAACGTLEKIVRDLNASNEKLAMFAAPPRSDVASAGPSEADVRSTAASLQHGLKMISTDLRRLVAFIGPQMRSMGMDTVRMTRQMERDVRSIATFRVAKIGEATKRFPDVPAGHWAAGAVQNLRSNGILHGYEDANFGG